MASTIKGPGQSTRSYDGTPLRIGILHTRWNSQIITALVSGARAALSRAGVADANIVVQDVPGAWELPAGVQRMYAASQIQSSQSGATGSVSAGDLLGGVAGGSFTDLTSSSTGGAGPGAEQQQQGPFDAIIAIGCLIKGATMHFEYIADATTHGLMRVQLDAGVPVVFGVLTVLDEGQALERAGEDGTSKKNVGEEWGEAAVELGVKRREWGRGVFS